MSLEKPKAFASKGATIARKHKLYTVSNIHFTNNLGRYLGFKIVHERITSSLFFSLMDNVRKHLAAWKGCLLNIELL